MKPGPAMTADVEGLLRRCAPQALGAVARRHPDFAAAEDAVQEALLAAAQQWPRDGVPGNPVGWLVRVAVRRLADEHREVAARRRREEVAAARDQRPPDDVEDHDDTLTVMLLCCHPALTPTAAIPLTLRAVGGLTTREIAAAFLVPEATMAQRISRAKATLRASDVPFAMPAPADVPRRLALVRHVLYLLFNEGYATSAGPELVRVDVTGEAIRLARMLRAAVPEDAEVTGLLALLLLTEARRPARSGPHGELVPLADQDRSLWDRALILEGVRLATDALRSLHLAEVATYFSDARFPRGAYPARAMSEAVWADLPVEAQAVLAEGQAVWEEALSAELNQARETGAQFGLENGIEFIEPEAGAQEELDAVYNLSGREMAEDLSRFGIDGVAIFERAQQLVRARNSGVEEICE